MNNLTETENIPNILGNESPLELESMLKNAIRFYGGNGKHDIKQNTVYSFNMEFMVDGNIVGIENLKLSKKCTIHEKSIIEESTIEEKYNEYDTLVNTFEMRNKTLGDTIKRKFNDVKIDVTRKNVKAPLI